MKSRIFRILWRCKQIRPLLWGWSPSLSCYLMMH
nr:MAG TPA: hypothetical protein [Caudoviricetes sp.]